MDSVIIQKLREKPVLLQVSYFLIFEIGILYSTFFFFFEPVTSVAWCGFWYSTRSSVLPNLYSVIYDKLLIMECHI